MILYIVGDEIFNISNFMLRNIILKQPIFVDAVFCILVNLCLSVLREESFHRSETSPFTHLMFSMFYYEQNMLCWSHYNFLNHRTARFNHTCFYNL